MQFKCWFWCFDINKVQEILVVQKYVCCIIPIPLAEQQFIFSI